MASNYAFQKYEAQKMARARLLNQGISTKDSIEIAKAIRGRSLEKSMALMEKVVAMQQPIRYTRFNSESASHKPGMSSGRYPVKAAGIFSQLLELVKANADQKDLDTDALKIVHIKADKAATPYHFGRHRGRKMKRTHLEIVVMEDDAVKAKSKKSTKKSVKKSASSKSAEKKTETKTEEKKEAKPEAKKEEVKKETPKAEAKPAAEKKVTEEKKETAAEKKTEEKTETHKESQESQSKEENKE